MKPLRGMTLTATILLSLNACTPPAAPEKTPPITKSPTLPPAKRPSPGNHAKPIVKTAAITEVDATRLFALKTEGKALLYDVRLPLYYKLGHIDGAVLFYPKPFEEAFAREKPQIDKSLREGKKIVLYCGGADCHDSHIVAKMFAERGIPVSVYSGGWAEWKELGIE